MLPAAEEEMTIESEHDDYHNDGNLRDTGSCGGGGKARSERAESRDSSSSTRDGRHGTPMRVCSDAPQTHFRRKNVHEQTILQMRRIVQTTQNNTQGPMKDSPAPLPNSTIRVSTSAQRTV